MRRREVEVVVRGSRARHQRRRPVLEGRIEWNAITRGKRKKNAEREVGMRVHRDKDKNKGEEKAAPLKPKGAAPA